MPEHWTARQKESEVEAEHLRILAKQQAEHIQQLEAEAQKVSLGLIETVGTDSEE